MGCYGMRFPLAGLTNFVKPVRIGKGHRPQQRAIHHREHRASCGHAHGKRSYHSD